MFYHHRSHYHCTHGFLFILGLIGAFFLGKHCEAHGYNLMSRWWRFPNTDDNINTDIPDDSTPSYPQ